MSFLQRVGAIIGVVGVLFVVFMVLLAYVQVPTGSVGIEKRWGATTGNSYNAGPHFITPFAESTERISIRPQTYTMSATEGEGNENRNDAVDVLTQNGVKVNVDISVRYRLNQTQAVEFYEQWQSLDQVEARLIRPTVRAQLRTRAGAIPTSEVYTASGQEKLRESVMNVLNQEFTDEALVLEEVQIRRIGLPQGYQQSINRKEEVKQQAQQKQYQLDVERREAERQRIQARGQADANRIVASSLTDEVLAQKQIEALRNGNSEVVYIPVGENGLPQYLDVSNASANSSTQSSNATNTLNATNATS